MYLSRGYSTRPNISAAQQKLDSSTTKQGGALWSYSFPPPVNEGEEVGYVLKKLHATTSA